MIDIPSPAVAVVGRHNSGKTTLVEQLIRQLVAEGLDVGSVKHHHRAGFEIDIPGKDSYRQRAAGASETFISAPGKIACIKTIEGEMECSDIVARMPGHDIVVVEGYRKSGIPTIEIMRQANERDAAVAEAFAAGARAGESLGTDFVQRERERGTDEYDSDLATKMPTANTVAVVTDIPCAREAAGLYGIPAFELDDVQGICAFLKETIVRPKISVVIQAGGESRRMGRSKATVPFMGRPLICRLVERLAPVADEVLITTNEADNLAFLLDDYPQYRIRLVPDLHKSRGAMPGLNTALDAASHPYVAVVACDMVFASPKLIVAESIAMNETGADAVVPVNKHGYEPFHAMYRRATCLPAVREIVDAGDKRAQSLFDRVNVLEFTRDQVLAAEPTGGCFLNANTPDDLAALERIVQENVKPL